MTCAVLRYIVAASHAQPSLLHWKINPWLDALLVSTLFERKLELNKRYSHGMGSAVEQQPEQKQLHRGTADGCRTCRFIHILARAGNNSAYQ